MGNELIKATNEELIKGIETVPIDTLIYHGKSNHFSNWLAARSNFEVATKLRKINVEKFKDKNDIEMLSSKKLKVRMQAQFGEVTDFSSQKIITLDFIKCVADLWEEKLAVLPLLKT